MTTPINENTVCKITEARLGDYDGRFGLHFKLSGSCWGVGHSRVFGWSGKPVSHVECIEAMEWLGGLLRDAKAESLHQLVGKPAVSEWRDGQVYGGMCTGFRIMTEVL